MRQIRVRFYTLKSAKVFLSASKIAKGIIWRLPRVSNFRRNITFSFHSHLIPSHFNYQRFYTIFNNAKILKPENVLTFVCKGSKILPKFSSVNGKGLKVPAACPPPPGTATKKQYNMKLYCVKANSHVAIYRYEYNV